MRTMLIVPLLAALVSAVGCSSSPVGHLLTIADPERTFDGIPDGPIAPVVGENEVRRPTLEERALLNDVTMALRACGFEALTYDEASRADVLLFCNEYTSEIEVNTYRSIPTTNQTYGTAYRGSRTRTYSGTTYGQEVVPVTERHFESTLAMRALDRRSYESRTDEISIAVLTFWSGEIVADAKAYNERRPEMLLELLARWGTTTSLPIPRRAGTPYETPAD